MRMRMRALAKIVVRWSMLMRAAALSEGIGGVRKVGGAVVGRCWSLGFRIVVAMMLSG